MTRRPGLENLFTVIQVALVENLPAAMLGDGRRRNRPGTIHPHMPRAAADRLPATVDNPATRVQRPIVRPK